MNYTLTATGHRYRVGDRIHLVQGRIPRWKACLWWLVDWLLPFDSRLNPWWRWAEVTETTGDLFTFKF